jgi:nitric oxide synthase oxygenase domain/subunit
MRMLKATNEKLSFESGISCKSIAVLRSLGFYGKRMHIENLKCILQALNERAEKFSYQKRGPKGGPRKKRIV